jgi:hypothetical protein
MAGMCWTFLTFAVPSMISMGGWLFANLANHAVGSVAFWQSLTVAIIMAASFGGPAVLAWRERRLRRAGVLQ